MYASLVVCAKTKPVVIYALKFIIFENMETGFWISVIVLLVGIFVTTFVSWFLTRKTLERMDERAKAVGMEIARAISPLAEVTASIKTEVRGVEKKIMRRRKRIR